MSSNDINLNNPLPSFEGLSFYVDAFSERKRIQSVMPIFYEEQPMTWMLYKDEIREFMRGRTNIRILDVGCGSGFWGILLKKKYPQSEVVCLDKNPVAIERTRYNALLNKLDITLVEAFYSKDLFDELSFDMIVLTPPYHLYDPKDTEKIPLFARGGEYGLQEFYSQTEIAFHHLKEYGMILYNQMSVGNECPDYVGFYKKTFDVGKLEYTNILPPIPTMTFLEKLYTPLDSNYLIKMANEMPTLYYTSGIYRKSCLSFVVEENTQSKSIILSNLQGNWQTRIDLHKEINKF